MDSILLFPAPSTASGIWKTLLKVYCIFEAHHDAIWKAGSQPAFYHRTTTKLIIFLAHTFWFVSFLKVNWKQKLIYNSVALQMPCPGQTGNRPNRRKLPRRGQGAYEGELGNTGCLEKEGGKSIVKWDGGQIQSWSHSFFSQSQSALIKAQRASFSFRLRSGKDGASYMN